MDSTGTAVVQLMLILNGMRIVRVVFLLFISLPAFSRAFQDTGKTQIDIRRLKYHEDIDAIQKKLAGADGREDGLIEIGGDEDVNLLLSSLFLTQTDQLQDRVERDGQMDHRLKVKYLAGIQIMLDSYHAAWKQGEVVAGSGVLFFEAFTTYMEADLKGEDISLHADRFPYQVNRALLGSQSVFFENKGLKTARSILFKQFGETLPDQALSQLEPYLEEPFAEKIIRAAAQKNPSLFYDYAAANQTAIGKKIASVDDPLVSLITRIAADPSGRLLFPFLHAIIQKRISIDAIREAIKDEVRYYKLLVSTQLQYLDETRRGDTPMLFHEVAATIKKKAEASFINTINGLHDEPDDIRFRVLQPLSAEELYYLIVTGENVLYTSSYTGVFARMMSRVPRSSGDSLLMRIRFDRFKKFIRMAAAYNKLGAFLSTMPPAHAQLLMTSFVRGLEKHVDLEDAVDVADSYSSIKDLSIRKLLVREVQKNLLSLKEARNSRGAAIYDILDLLFQSANDSVSRLSVKYRIPPAYFLPYQNLADKAGRIIQQVFFYGDKDGKESFVNFMSLFKGRAEWKITQNQHWVEIKSLIGKPILIYANLPLDNSKGDDPDAEAQRLLGEHLYQNGLEPTVVIHRGHSYHLKYTLEQLPNSAQIVVLGSCGSYQNLNTVLELCPEAHIVSSKEVGTKLVNEPVLAMINESLRSGKGVDWIRIWSQLEARFASGPARERFDNYIPPHKNLGALFIKAFNNRTAEDL